MHCARVQLLSQLLLFPSLLLQLQAFRTQIEGEPPRMLAKQVSVLRPSPVVRWAVFWLVSMQITIATDRLIRFNAYIRACNSAVLERVGQRVLPKSPVKNPDCELKFAVRFPDEGAVGSHGQTGEQRSRSARSLRGPAAERKLDTVCAKPLRKKYISRFSHRNHANLAEPPRIRHLYSIFKGPEIRSNKRLQQRRKQIVMRK